MAKKRNTEYMRTVWLAWAQWNDGSWGVWGNLGCGRNRADLKELAVQYLLDHNIKWALRDRGGRTTYNNRIRLRKHVIPYPKGMS